MVIATWPRRVESGRYPHGTHAKHNLEGCRCLRCRAATSNYETERQRKKRADPWHVYASPAQADEVLRHIIRLRSAGIGLRQIAVAAGLNRKTVRELVDPEIRPQRGRAAHRRPRRVTCEKILAVTTKQRAGAAYVPAQKTWQLLDILRSAGYSKRRLAIMLGSHTPRIQFRKHQVLVRSARRTARLFKMLWLKDVRLRQLAGNVAPVEWRLALAMGE